MSWWTYVTHASGTDSPKAMSLATGIDAPSFSKMKTQGHIPKPETVARFARAYGRPVLEAFVAAGFLEPEEAKVRPGPSLDFSRLTNKQLLELVESRMIDDGSGFGGASIRQGPWGNSDPVSDPASTVPEDKVAMDDPDLLPEAEAQEEEP
jgi:hypothetical protein